MSYATSAEPDLDEARGRAGDLGPYLPRVLAVFNGKGGAGKTSVAANMSGLLAMAGYRVLLVDTDLGSSLGLNLGYKGGSEDDGGAGLARAMATGSAPSIITVRPNLDVIPGGLELRHVPPVTGPADRLMLAEVIAPLAPDYDWIMVDCPAIAAWDMVTMALTAARAALVPIGYCRGSVVGLEGVARVFTEARQLNPGLDLLGLVMFGFDYRDGPEVGKRKRARAELVTYLEGAGIEPVVFDSVIRQARRVGDAEREMGKLAAEIGLKAIPKAATVAQEYEALTREALTRFLDMEGNR